MMASSPISDQALGRLLESQEQFLSFLRKRVADPEVARDLLQNAFVKAIERGGNIRDEESVVAWFYRVLRNSLIDHYRRAGSQNVARSPAEDLPIQPQVAHHNEVCECLSPLVDNLKPEYRDAIRLVDLEDRGLADLAAHAQISEGNAAVRVHRARQAMRKQVEMACGSCAEHHCVDCHCEHQ